MSELKIFVPTETEEDMENCKIEDRVIIDAMYKVAKKFEDGWRKASLIDGGWLKKHLARPVGFPTKFLNSTHFENWLKATPHIVVMETMQKLEQDPSELYRLCTHTLRICSTVQDETSESVAQATISAL